MSVSGVAITRLRKSSREIPAKKNICQFKQSEKRIRLYLPMIPFQRSGMSKVWRIRTRYFPCTSPCNAAYSTALQYIKPSLQANLSLSVYFLQMAMTPAIQPHQPRTQDIHASRTFVWRWNFQLGVSWIFALITRRTCGHAGPFEL